jgi:hypothetical protein
MAKVRRGPADLAAARAATQALLSQNGLGTNTPNVEKCAPQSYRSTPTGEPPHGVTIGEPW